jgi:hypothetical protein
MQRKKQNKKRKNGNSKVVTLPRAKATKMRTSQLKNMPLKHTEFVQDIVSNDDSYSFEQIPVNPGLEAAFPWGCRIASGFESYKIVSLTYRFVTNRGTDTNGSIAIIPDYDAADDNSTQTKQQMLAYQDGVRGPIWSDLTMKCTKQNLEKRKTYFVRQATVASDIRLYDALSLNLILSGLPSGTTVGELWVDYHFVLLTPQLEPFALESQDITKTQATSTNEPFRSTEVIGEALGLKVGSYNDIEFTEAGDYIMNAVLSFLPGTGPATLIKTPLMNPDDGEVIELANVLNSDTSEGVGQWLIRTARDIGKSKPANIYWDGIDGNRLLDIGSVISFLGVTGNTLATIGKARALKKKQAKLTEKEIVKILSKNNY